MAEFQYHVTLIDTKANRTSMRFDLADTAYVDAATAAAAIEAAIELVTDASVFKSTLVEILTGDASLPADADVTDEALVVCYLSGTGEVPKYWNLRIPAPVEAMFNEDLVTVDITYQNLQDLVSTLSTEAKVSDNESLNLDIQEGIKNGYWRSVKKSTG